MKPYNFQTLDEICKQCHGLYNDGEDYLGVTFNNYADMHAFMKSSLYRILRPYRILSRYTKYLYFRFA